MVSIFDSFLQPFLGYDSSNQTLKSKVEEYEEAHAMAHPVQEKVLYLMRGYANLMEGSMTQTSKRSQVPSLAVESNQETQTLDLTPLEIINVMAKLIDRMNAEGELYVQIRSKLLLQLSQLSKASSLPYLLEDDVSGFDKKNVEVPEEEDEAETEDEQEQNNAWRLERLVSSFGSAPGATPAMYDVVLDAHACLLSQTEDEVITLSLLNSSHDLLVQLEERHELDESQGYDYHHPTQCTYNAVLRGCASVPTSVSSTSEEVRDIALVNATRVFDTLVRGKRVVRNSATYTYYLQTLRKLLPKSPAAGNIAYSVWFQAMTHDYVVDSNNINALFEFDKGYGKDFDEWMNAMRHRYEEGTNGFGFPMKWSRNKNARKYDKRSNCY